jgi:hypothetical protein
MEIKLMKNIMNANENLAAGNRAFFKPTESWPSM